MKANIHPKLNKLSVEFNDGTSQTVLWTGREDSIKPNLDPTNHAAWTGNYSMRAEGDRADAFTKRFATRSQK